MKASRYVFKKYDSKVRGRNALKKIQSFLKESGTDDLKETLAIYCGIERITVDRWLAGGYLKALRGLSTLQVEIWLKRQQGQPVEPTTLQEALVLALADGKIDVATLARKLQVQEGAVLVWCWGLSVPAFSTMFQLEHLLISTGIWPENKAHWNDIHESIRPAARLLASGQLSIKQLVEYYSSLNISAYRLAGWFRDCSAPTNDLIPFLKKLSDKLPALQETSPVETKVEEEEPEPDEEPEQELELEPEPASEPERMAVAEVQSAVQTVSVFNKPQSVVETLLAILPHTLAYAKLLAEHGSDKELRQLREAARTGNGKSVLFDTIVALTALADLDTTMDYREMLKECR